MNLGELINNIKSYNIPASLYSINEGLKPDAYILNKNYQSWEYFYIDERGIRSETIIFSNEEEAFDFLWNKLLFEVKYPPSAQAQV